MARAYTAASGRRFVQDAPGHLTSEDGTVIIQRDDYVPFVCENPHPGCFGNEGHYESRWFSFHPDEHDNDAANTLRELLRSL